MMPEKITIQVEITVNGINCDPGCVFWGEDYWDCTRFCVDLERAFEEDEEGMITDYVRRRFKECLELG